MPIDYFTYYYLIALNDFRFRGIKLNIHMSDYI